MSRQKYIIKPHTHWGEVKSDAGEERGQHDDINQSLTDTSEGKTIEN